MPTRLHGDRRECPITRCPRTVRPGHLMCGVHWRQVPREIQTLVWSSWRSWNRTHSDDAWEAYTDARLAALRIFEEDPHG